MKTYRIDFVVEGLPPLEDVQHSIKKEVAENKTDYIDMLYATVDGLENQVLLFVELVDAGFTVSRSKFFHHSSSYQSVNVTGDLDKIAAIVMKWSHQSLEEAKEELEEVI